jgi:small subunit ribosomal protein S6
MSATYDLMLLLDADAPGERREQILAETAKTISSTGEIVSRHDWGTRSTAYEIRHQNTADYHLIQFTGPVALLESLQHTLRITDGVVRYRIIKLRPGTPAPPDVRPEVRPAAPVETEAEAPAAPEAEAPAPEAEAAPAPAEAAPSETEAPAAPEAEAPAAEAGPPAAEAEAPAEDSEAQSAPATS